MTDEIIIRRLSIIKHLYKLGIDQAALSETISYTSILTLHDSLDMFMNLAAEKKGVNKGLFLMQYFDFIPELTLKSSVDKINKRRNSLKHNGIVPGKVEIQDTCAVAKVFLEENSNIIFGKDFAEISIFNLIAYPIVREFLIDSNTLFQTNKFDLAANEIAKAYYNLLRIEAALGKSEKKNPWYGSEPQPLIMEGKFYTKAMEPLFVGQENLFKEPKTKDGYVEITEGVAAISYNNNKALSYIFESLRFLTLGLDYRKYNFYTSFMPIVYNFHVEENQYFIGLPIQTKKTPEKFMTKENIAFALDFVLEFALQLQQFKY